MIPMNRKLKRAMAKLKMDNKGQFNFLTSAGIALIVLVVAIMVGAYIANQMGTNLGANTTAKNVTIAGEKAFKIFSDWFNIIIIVIIAVAIIGLVLLIGGARRR